jgi:hypothetical protein
LNNTRDIWLGNFPISILTFVLIHLIYKLLSHYKVKLRMKVIAFKWFCILFNSIICQNIQYISFRSFQHIFFGGSPFTQGSPIIFFLNFIACYFSLFLAIICSVGGTGIIRYFIGNKIKYVLDLVNYSNSTLWFISISQLQRVVNGLAHGGFYNNIL